MSFDPQPPLDAIVLPDSPPPRRIRWWWIAGGAIVCSALCAGVGFWLLARLYGVISPAASVATQWESATEKRAALRRAFDGQWHALNDPDLGHIRRLLDRVAATGNDETGSEFCKLVDFGHFVQRLQSYPGMRRLNWLERQVLERTLRDEVDGPGNVQEFQLVHLDRLSQDMVLAYALAINDEVSGDPFRLWLVRSQGGWRVFDWERIETGLSETAQEAVLQVASRDPRYRDYLAGANELTAADELMEKSDTEAAERRLEAAHARVVPTVVADFWHYLLALRWSQLGKVERCLEVCRRARNPDAIPGFYTLQAAWLQNQARHAEALQMVEHYERVAGFQPEMARVRGRLLAELKRPEEAQACWRRLVAFTPDNTDDLFAYCESLPADRRSEVLAVVRNAKAPVQAAAQLARRWLYQDDENTLTLLAGFVSQQSPGSPTALDLEGTILEYQGEYEEAAARFRQAAERETDSEQKVSHWDSFLDAMAQAGRAAEGYQAMPDAQAALKQLAGGIEDGDALIGLDELPAVLDAHRQRAPDDPWLHYYTGLLADERHDEEQAAREFAAAAKTDDEDLQSLVRYRQRDLLVRQGKVLEAYQAYASDPEVFRELADACHAAQDAQGLNQLLDAHRGRQRDDPWLAYYAAVSLKLANQLDAALAALDALQGTQDESLQSYVRSLKSDVLFELGRWRAVYEQGEEPRDEFRTLAGMLRGRRDWVGLRELCELHRARCPDDWQWLSQTVDLAAVQKDGERVVQLLTPWPAGSEWSEYKIAEMRRHLIESLLRLGRAQEALERARAFAQTDRDPVPLMLVFDRRRQWQELERLLADAEIGRQFNGELRFDHRGVFQAYFTDPAAASLRIRFPPPLPSELIRSRVILLLAGTAPLTAESLRSLTGEDRSLAVRRLPTSRPDISAVFEVRDSQGWGVVAAGSGTYGDPPQVRHRLDAALLTALREHGGWLEIQGVGAFVDEDPTPAERLVRELAAGLCDLEVQALHVWGARDAHARLALADASTAARLRSPERLDTVFADAPPLYLERRAAGGESSGDTTDPNRRRELRAFARSVAAHGREQPHLVRVRLQLGAASEDLWLRVVSAEPTDYGQHKFTGELRGDSQLWPHLKKGEWLVIEAHEVQEWTRETP